MNVKPEWIMVAQQVDEGTADPDVIQMMAEQDSDFVMYLIERARARLAGDLQ